MRRTLYLEVDTMVGGSCSIPSTDFPNIGKTKYRAPISLIRTKKGSKNGWGTFPLKKFWRQWMTAFGNISNYRQMGYAPQTRPSPRFPRFSLCASSKDLVQ